MGVAAAYAKRAREQEAKAKAALRAEKKLVKYVVNLALHSGHLEVEIQAFAGLEDHEIQFLAEAEVAQQLQYSKLLSWRDE